MESYLFYVSSDKLDALVFEPRDVEEPGGPEQVDHVPGLQKRGEKDAALTLQVRQQQHLGGLQRLVHVVNRQLKVIFLAYSACFASSIFYRKISDVAHS